MLPMHVRPEGSMTARIMIVLDAPSQEDVRRGHILTDSAGMELDRILHDAGIARTECFVTSVCRAPASWKGADEFVYFKKTKIPNGFIRYKDKWCSPEVEQGASMLAKEIAMIKPNVIIALGNLAMFALTDLWGVKTWRASLLENTLGGHYCKVIPTYAPASILKQYALRLNVVSDIKRVATEQNDFRVIRPTYNFIIRPSYNQAFSFLQMTLEKLDKGKLHISTDIETRAGQIACIGYAISKVDAICIPLMTVEDPEGYWMPEEEVALLWMLYKILTHPNAWGSGQNFSYDAQYIKRYLHFIPRLEHDTMTAHHSMMPGSQKSLDYLSSMYCEQHLYWKDDGKEWNVRGYSEDVLWRYNCIDCVRTFEIAEAQLQLQPKLVSKDVFDFQQNMFYLVLAVMERGINPDRELKSKFSRELRAAITAREEFLNYVVGYPLNPKSPKQMQTFFYEEMQQPVIKNFKTKAPTCDDDALTKIKEKTPLLQPICDAILELRSLGVFLSTFVESGLDADGKIRCSYNLSGTETFRLSSSQNAFGSGLNLQNIPSGGKGDSGLVLPNIRKLFIPEIGMVFFDGDLDRADLQVVAWEANEEGLKEALRKGYDLHLWNASDLFDLRLDPETLIETHPDYNAIKKEFAKLRHLAKGWVHGTNYGGGAVTMARNCGISVAQAENLRFRYFKNRPGIAEWHAKTEENLRKKRYIENAFGFRRYYFDRPDGLLPQALAWIPQSTVANYINMIWVMLQTSLPEVEILLQVHDSLGGQMPADRAEELRLEMSRLASTIVIPYADPLVIPFSVNYSPLSWGDCK